MNLTVDELIGRFPLKTNFYFYKNGEHLDYKYISGSEIIENWVVNDDFDVLVFFV